MQKMAAVQDLYDKLCTDIARMADERNKDIDRITHTEMDWEIRDHVVRVRCARFICETADMERMRISVRRDMAQQLSGHPISVLTNIN